jgi:hypothetical protein
VLAQHESGLVAGEDGYVHAVQKKISGDAALCGAGRITQMIPGRFERDDERACPQCCSSEAQ